MRPRMQSFLDRIVRLRIGRTPAFRACGYCGMAAGCAAGGLLAWHAGLSLPVVGLLTACAAVTFLTVAMTTKVIGGEERLVYYHHEIAILAACAIVLRSLGLSVGSYLDVAAMSLGAFLICGRVGCLMAGCCHGRPSRWGVRYGAGHVSDGFPRLLLGVRLVPVQLMESCAVSLIVLAGCVAIWRGCPAGTGLRWYIGAYAVLRFWLEYWRGDSGRGRYAHLNEAQWTSAVLLGLAWPPWTILGSVLCVVAGRRVFRRLRHSDEVMEIAAALERARLPRDVPTPETTPHGVRLSVGSIGVKAHYAVSGVPGESAWEISELLLRLEGRQERSWELVSGGNGVFHVLVG